MSTAGAGSQASGSITRFNAPSTLLLDVSPDGAWRDDTTKYQSTTSFGFLDILRGRRGKTSQAVSATRTFTSKDIVIKGQ
jgi:hypothetical protein